MNITLNKMTDIEKHLFCQAKISIKAEISDLAANECRAMLLEHIVGIPTRPHHKSQECQKDVNAKYHGDSAHSQETSTGRAGERIKTKLS